MQNQSNVRLVRERAGSLCKPRFLQLIITLPHPEVYSFSWDIPSLEYQEQSAMIVKDGVKN